MNPYISPWNPDGEQLVAVRQGLPERWIRNCLQWSLAMLTAVSHISHKQGRLIPGSRWYPLISLILQGCSNQLWVNHTDTRIHFFWWWIYSFITCYVLLYVSSFPSLYFLTVGGSLVLCCFTSNVLGIPRRIFSLLGFDWNSWQPGPSCILEQLFWSGTAFLELPRVKWFVQGYQFTTYYLLRLTNKFDIFQELKGKS